MSWRREEDILGSVWSCDQGKGNMPSERRASYVLHGVGTAM